MRSETLTFAAAGLALAIVLPMSAAAQQARAPFDGYTPARCAVAARVVDGLVTRGVVDTAAWKPGGDTLATATVDTLRVCQAAFGGTTADPLETLNLARVQLFTRQDEAAIETARRHMGTMATRTPAVRAWELYLIARDNLAGQPARLEQADAAIAELDRMGRTAATVRILVHFSRGAVAFTNGDDAKAESSTSAAIAAWKELDRETGLWRAGTLAGTFLVRAQLAALTKGGDAARAVIDTARGVIPPAAAQARAIIENAGRMYQVMGKPAGQIEGTFWYNAGAAERVRPGRGKVAVLVDMVRPCTHFCPSMVRAMKRFDRAYRERGAEITFYTRTYGYYVDTAPASPFEEARYDSSYFLGEWELPGALAIEETQYSWKADGRRLNAPTVNQVNYPGAMLAIVDRRGIVRYVAQTWQEALEPRYARLIEQLLAESGP